MWNSVFFLNVIFLFVLKKENIEHLLFMYK